MNTFSQTIPHQKGCRVCHAHFDEDRIKYACQRCKRKICVNCVRESTKAGSPELTNDYKICTICENELRFQSEFIAQNNTSWGKLSVIGKEWAEICRLKESSNESYADYLKLSKEPDTKFNDFKIIDRDVLEGRSNRSTFNFSLQDYLYHNQQGFEESRLKEMTSNVLKAYCMKFPTIGYTQGMSYVTVFLLSLMDEESVFWTWVHVVTNILPAKFYASTRQGVPLMGYQQEKYIILTLAKSYLNLDEKTMTKVESFMEINGPALLVPLLVNYLNFQVLYETWDDLLKTQSFNIFRKVAIKSIQLLLPKILKKSPISPSYAQSRIVKLFTIEEFRKAKEEIVISEGRIKELEEIFKKDFSSQWMSNQSHIHYTLHRVTHFTKEEVMELQNEFKRRVELYSPVNTGHSDSKPYGIKEDDFRAIMQELTSEDHEERNFLKSLDLDKIFKVFDVDKSGKLDFKEFLFSLSMLMRGTLEERVHFAFQVLDVGDKGYLTAVEYEQFVKSIVQAALVSNQGNFNPFFKDDLQKFEDNMMALINSRETITFLDMKKDLLAHDFMKYCNINAEARRNQQIARSRHSSVHKSASEYSKEIGSRRQSTQIQAPVDLSPDNKAADSVNSNSRKESNTPVQDEPLDIKGRSRRSTSTILDITRQQPYYVVDNSDDPETHEDFLETRLKRLATSENFYSGHESEADKKKQFKIHQEIKKALEKGGLTEDGQEPDQDRGANRDCQICNLF